MSTGELNHATAHHHHSVPKFSHYIYKHMHALKGLACRKRAAAACSPAATCKKGAALTSLCDTLAAAPGLLVHASVTEVVKFSPMGVKLQVHCGVRSKEAASIHAKTIQAHQTHARRVRQDTQQSKQPDAMAINNACAQTIKQ
jgi:hypothetical protein